MDSAEDLIEHLRNLPGRLLSAVDAVEKRPQLEALSAEFVGPRGALTVLIGKISSLPKEMRSAVGKEANAVKAELLSLLGQVEERIGQREIEGKIGKTIDPTLALPHSSIGCRHPLSLVRDRIVEIFRTLGFSAVEATEMETEWTCFDALNMASTHPARDTMDTFFFPQDLSCGNVKKHGDERFLLRTHCTTVQIRSLLRGDLPLKVIAPGRVFRRDTADATHSANFHQCDVIHVDRNVSVADLKASVDFFLHGLFGEDVEMRYRPSFFPFTVPSYEVDMRVSNLGKLSNVWVEILGCGMIHPNVFQSVGIDGNCWSGQAWGIGIERIAMLLYGIDDVRHFYRNDFRFISQFR
ncbi:MAG: phenylalanine--tRNA ligase subunit alpha [Puniceicoccales bacterium]|jgi:phenylalanyl-tRNA synthetase alpha chain|nr:phenylalanine--tRNA ligase subunit alpha [Puniceicoccales bacterium]